MLKEFFIKNRQHVIIIALFLAISVIYCYPVLSGKVMNQNDDLTAKALTREAEEYHKKTGDFIGWSNTMFSGMPASVGYSGPSNYSIQLIYAFANAFDGFSFDVIFWCLVGMYILFCALGITPWLGALGSFIFAFSTFNILSLEGGHVQKTFNIALVPLLLGGIYLIFQKRYVWGFIAVAFGVNYQVGLSHYQITYYAALAAAVLCIYYGIVWLKEKEFKALGIAIGLLLLGAALGTLPNLTLLNTYYASHETTRGGASELTQAAGGTATPAEGEANSAGLDFDYATQWSYGLGETFTLLVPDAYGGADNAVVDRKTGKPKKDSETFQALQQNVKDNNEFNDYIQMASSYWGDQPFVGGPIYFGAIVCFLFVIGIIASNRKEKWWILALTVLFLFLAWGRHSVIYELCFSVLPVFNKFRTPSMALGIVQIGVSLLAILAITAIVNNENKDKLAKIVLYTGAGFGALLLIMIVAPSMLFGFESAREATMQLPDWFSSALISDREAMMKSDAIRSLVFVALAFGLIWFYLKGTIKSGTTFMIVIAALIVFDLWSVNTRYLNKDNFVKRKDYKYKATEADNAIYQQAQQEGLLHYRVFNLTINPTQDARTSQLHRSIGGYHGAKLRKYQELLDSQLYKNNMSVLSMLNTSYLLVNGQNGIQPQLPPVRPMGNAWFVREVKQVANADKEMAALNVDSANIFDPAKTLVVQTKNLPEGLKNFTPAYDSAAQIKLVNYAPHILKYESNASSDQMAVFSEVFYEQPDGDGWKAFIDGQPAEHFRGDYVLRAMKVPAGKHTIEFKYDASKALGRVKMSFVFFVLLLAVSITALFIERKNKLKALKPQ